MAVFFSRVSGLLTTHMCYSLCSRGTETVAGDTAHCHQQNLASATSEAPNSQAVDGTLRPPLGAQPGQGTCDTHLFSLAKVLEHQAKAESGTRRGDIVG